MPAMLHSIFVLLHQMQILTLTQKNNKNAQFHTDKKHVTVIRPALTVLLEKTFPSRLFYCIT